ncbi:hypothetical protein BaRGS_00037288 [Batillaria attramentaria]|uniref:Uncharacterized protein n=1 Tax=Batillaria attramentaria TaxID=370345 RepID=A0ABD0J962_9CAEN
MVSSNTLGTYDLSSVSSQLDASQLDAAQDLFLQNWAARHISPCCSWTNSCWTAFRFDASQLDAVKDPLSLIWAAAAGRIPVGHIPVRYRPRSSLS